MGWCSATEIFDNVVGSLIGDSITTKKQTIKNLIVALEGGDWDCQYDSAYIGHPLVRECFEEIHPGMFEDE